jgi:hypothetical protein
MMRARNSMRAAMRRTPRDGFPALRLMGFGKTAANNAASLRVNCDTDFLK